MQFTLTINMEPEDFRRLFNARGYSESPDMYVGKDGRKYNASYWFTQDDDGMITRLAAQQYLKELGFDSEVRQVPGYARWELLTDFYEHN